MICLVFSDHERKHAHFYVYCASPCKEVKLGKLRVRCASCRGGAFTVDRDPQCWNDVLEVRRITGDCQNDGCVSELWYKIPFRLARVVQDYMFLSPCHCLPWCPWIVPSKHETSLWDIRYGYCLQVPPLTLSSLNRNQLNPVKTSLNITLPAFICTFKGEQLPAVALLSYF